MTEVAGPSPAVVPSTCPVCEQAVLEPFLRVAGVPVVTTELWPSQESALGAGRGNLELAVCPACGVIRNLDFDPGLMAYTATYENSQHFSPAFTAYTRTLARRLVASYGLEGGVVVEIGSGKGEFLAMLCEEGVARGVGFDPTYDGEVDDRDLGERLTFVRENFDEAHADQRADLICCRHVLEHLEDPLGLLRSIRRTTGDRRTPLYFEVPNADFVLGPAGQWDLIYPHVSYFSAPSLRLLFERAGFEVLDLRASMHDQFLSIEARPAASERPPAVADAGAVARVAGKARSFATEYRQTLDRWATVVSGEHGVALWGAGAKGVTFLNVVATGGSVGAVVDVNPRKQGSYVPGTGHRVMAPAELPPHQPHTVLVMNALYQDEIQRQLASLDLYPTLVSV